MTLLVQRWSKQFMKTHPNVPVSVSSGDSRSGIMALIDRTTDLAAASRDLTPEEEKLAAEKGNRLQKVTVARDAIAIIVNNKNPISVLTLSQLKDIFTGAKKNWKEVGGPSHPISVLCREEGSGTYSYFRQHVLHGEPFAESAEIIRSSGELTQAVNKQQWSIAYEGLGYASYNDAHVHIVKLKVGANSEPVEPTPASAVTSYPLSRPLILFYDKDAKQSVREFINFIMGPDGQKIVQEAGNVPLVDH